MRAEQSLMLRLAESQIELRPVLQQARRRRRRPPGRTTRMRAICATSSIYLARLSEEMAHGRGELVQEMRSEIRLLARTIAALADEPQRS